MLSVIKNFEVEIKSLLSTKEKADLLLLKLKEKYPNTKKVRSGSQLNHYFITPNDPSTLHKSLLSLVSDNSTKKEELENIFAHGKKISLRSRDSDGKVILVIKASVGDDTSSNGVKRVEFELVVKMTLEELDNFLLKAGCKYQAKWSREREEYEADGMHVCLDKNAGYGYVAEFERVIQDSSDSALEDVRKELLFVMKELGVEELPQERLERMFAHYNENWQKYYGTENTFTLD